MASQSRTAPAIFRRRAAGGGKIEALLWKFGQQLLALGLTVIIEWGTWGRAERDTLRLGARALGAAVELHYLAAPADVLFDRIQRRGLEKPPIEREALTGSFEMFQAPTPEERALFDKPVVAEPASGETNPAPSSEGVIVKGFSSGIDKKAPEDGGRTSRPLQIRGRDDEE